MESIREGLIKRIHINQHNIKYNTKNKGKKPVVSVKTSKGNIIGSEAIVKGASRIVYSPYKPMACGAKVWLETKAEVVVND